MKKFLALVLALVMTMSLVTISAGAEDFTDNSSINYEEAVDVMTAIGVVGGYADGSFNPTAGLTRGAAAKIICNMLLGPTTAEALVANEAPFSDVAVDNVFAGYIAYCANEGIISGYADGTFKPAAPLTGYAFMKMLLGALGYDASIEGYVGTNWSIQVAKRALNIGLDKGLEGDFAGAKALTREEACLYAFNTMKADMVKYNNKSTISVGDLVISQTSEATTYTDKNDALIWDEDGTDVLQFAEKFFSDLRVAPATDAYGRPATSWTNDGDAIGTYADAADFVYVNAYNKAAVKALEKADYVVSDAKTTVYYNGVEGALTVADLKHGDNAITGYTIELFNTDKDKDIEVAVVVEEYFAQVGKFTAANEKKETEAKVVLKVTEATAGTFELTIVDDPDSDTDAYDKLAAYEKDDYVSVVLKGGWGEATDKAAHVLAVNSVEAVEGKLQKVTDNGYNYKSTVKMDGVTYKMNNECVGLRAAVATTEGTLYLDAQGVVIGWVAKTDAVTDKAIAVVDCFKTLEDGKLVTKVEGVLSNGEKTTLTVDTDYSEFVVYTYSDVDEDGVYVLARAWAAPADGATCDTTQAFATTTKKFDAAYISEDVKFIFVDDANDELTVKAGLQDVAAGVQKYVTFDAVDGVLYVTAVYVDAAPAAGTATADALIYVVESTGTISIEIDDEDETFTTYKAYVNGELVEDFYSADSVSAGFYKNVVDSKTGAYILSGKAFVDTDEIAVVNDLTVTAFAAKVVNGTYGVASAEVIDLSTGFDGIEVGASVSMIVDVETMEALFVYVQD